MKRYIDCAVPVRTCNLRCHYCYITHNRLFDSEITKIGHSKEEIRKALSYERLGGACLINMCAGGETLLSPEILPIIYELLCEGHYIMIVTNGTVTPRFYEIASWPKELLKRLFIKFSFQYLEMLRLNWHDRFFSNVHLMKENGVSFTVEVTPSDELVPYIPALKELCIERLGALCHVTIARDEKTEGFEVLSKYSFEEYKQIWRQFDSELFDFKSKLFYVKRKEFCYAGDWSLFLDLGSGVLRQCVRGKTICNIYEDVSNPIPYEAIGHKCQFPHCYNGHSYLAFGDIPELRTPTYTQIRDRVCTDGSHWLQPEMAAFMATRLYDSNTQYSLWKKGKINIKNASIKLRRKLGNLKRKLLR